MLQRRFNAFHLLLLTINGMVGSAWLFAPLYAARLAGPWVIVAWIVAGIANLMIALTFAELSSMLPVAGGTTRFAQLSHGVIAGYVISWVSWLSCVTMAPIEVQAMLQYAGTYFSFLTHVVNGIPLLTPVGFVCAFLIMVALCFINIKSFKGLVSVNWILFVFKMCVIFATIALLMHHQFIAANFSAHLDVQNSSQWSGIFAAIASGGIVFAFTGFKHCVELAGEVKNPQFSVPFAMAGAVIFCLLIYVGLQLAFIGALNPADLAHGWKHLSFSGDIGPFVGVATSLGLVVLVRFLYIDAVVSPMGTGMIYTTSTARIIYAMSKNGYLPKILAKLNPEAMPIAAIIFNFAVGMFLFLPLPGWQTMVSFLVSAVVISYAMGPISLICLRKQLPDFPRPFKLKYPYIFCFIAFYFCNLISYWAGWQTISKLGIAIAVGLLILVYAVGKKQIAEKLGLRSLWFLAPYLGGLLIISYFGSFGGKGIIGLGWDFLIIGIFTVVIFVLAILSRQPSIEARMLHALNTVDYTEI